MTTTLDERGLFLQISVWLTGFDEAELQGTGMLETYYETVISKNTASDVRYFFDEVAKILAAGKNHEAQIEKSIASNLMPISAYSNLAQNIITMWYTGNWGSGVISGQAYVQGLVWDAAETHPPGAKQPGYGSWSMPPL